MAGKLSTHVLDIYHGRPATGLVVELWEGESGKRIKTVAMNADGRADGPLLSGAEFHAGTFELRFAVGAYFRETGAVLKEPLFLDVVPVRFTVADATASYHVPSPRLAVGVLDLPRKLNSPCNLRPTPPPRWSIAFCNWAKSATNPMR